MFFNRLYLYLFIYSANPIYWLTLPRLCSPNNLIFLIDSRFEQGFDLHYAMCNSGIRNWIKKGSTWIEIWEWGNGTLLIVISFKSAQDDFVLHHGSTIYHVHNMFKAIGAGLCNFFKLDGSVSISRPVLFFKCTKNNCLDNEGSSLVALRKFKKWERATPMSHFNKLFLG